MNSLDLLEGEYNRYYQPYLDALGKVELLKFMQEQLTSFNEFIVAIPDEKLNYSYGKDKWTLAEVLLHILDTERIFQYRALRFGRNDKTELPGFDQDIYVPNCIASERTTKEIQIEFESVRQSSITLFKSFTDIELKRIGTASGSPMSVRALGFLICGHLKHHQNILMERYL